MFKVGDTVICINNNDNDDILILGKTYTIADVNNHIGVCKIKELPLYDWFVSRFKLESEKMITQVDIDPLVEIPQSEYTALIEEINLLQELLVEANQKLVNVEPQESEEFKPVIEYTMEDWVQAVRNDWRFEQRDGSVVNIISVDDSDTNYNVETETAWLKLNGYEYDFGYSSLDIIRRVK